MAKTWRPDNWINKYKEFEEYLRFNPSVVPAIAPQPLSEIYEAGADAMYPYALEKGKPEGRTELMLKALRGGSSLPYPTANAIPGKWVFIPDGEVVYIPTCKKCGKAYESSLLNGGERICPMCSGTKPDEES